MLIKFCQMIKRDKCTTKQAPLKSHHSEVQADSINKIFLINSEEVSKVETLDLVDFKIF